MKSEQKRIKKFNGGRGAILCNKCRVIVKEGFVVAEGPFGQITHEDWQSEEPIYCKDCKKLLEEGAI